MEIKPGVKSSEFWVALIAQVVPVLVIIGAIPASDAEGWTNALTTIVASIVAIITAVSYIWGRVELKKEQLRLEGMKSGSA